MEQRRLRSIHVLLAFTLVLPVALACSSTSDENGGGADSPLGQQMAELGDLGDEFIGENEDAYDGLAQAAELLSSALGSTSAAIRTKGGAAECLPPGIAGTTFALSSGVYVPTGMSGASATSVRFLIYRVSNGVPTDEVIGTLDVTCTGVLPNVSVTVSMTVDGVELLNLVTANPFFSPTSFSAIVTGVLRNATGSDEIRFGVLANQINIDEFYDFSFIDFEVAPQILAEVEHSRSMDPSFGDTESLRIRLHDPLADYSNFEHACSGLLLYQAVLDGMGGGLTGSGMFCAPPPLADGYNYFVNCFEGTLDDMTVSAADPPCLREAVLDPTPVSQGQLDQIQRGTNAVLGMFDVVHTVGRAGGEFLTALATSQQP